LSQFPHVVAVDLPRNWPVSELEHLATAVPQIRRLNSYRDGEFDLSDCQLDAPSALRLLPQFPNRKALRIDRNYDGCAWQHVGDCMTATETVVVNGVERSKRDCYVEALRRDQKKPGTV
jgi:hypothetical protein